MADNRSISPSSPSSPDGEDERENLKGANPRPIPSKGPDADDADSGWSAYATGDSQVDQVLRQIRPGSCPPDEPDGRRGQTADSTIKLPGLPAKFIIHRLVSEGGMGQVYEGYDKWAERPVAIKVARREGEQALLGAAIERERALLVGMRDSGIVSVYEAGRLGDGSPFYAMEFVDGLPLDEYVRTYRLNLIQTLTLVLQITMALHKAHIVNVVHRDLKPGNILVTPDGQPRIVDFGLAKQLTPTRAGAAASDRPPGPRPTAASLTGAVGTPRYMSPEQSAGQPIDASTDIYALGVIVSDLLAAEKENPALSTPAEKRVHRAQRPDNQSAGGCELIEAPGDVRAIIRKSLRRDPRQRYADAGELAEELHRYLSGFPVSAMGDRAVFYRLHKHTRRHRIICATVGMSVLAVAIVIWLSFVRISRERNAAEAARDRATRNEQQATLQRNRAEQTLRLAKSEREKLASALQQQGTDTAVAALEARDYAAIRPALSKVPPDRRGWEHQWLEAVALHAPGPTEIVGCHEWAVLDMKLSPDGRWLATTGQDGRVLVWDLATNASHVLEGGRWLARERRWELAAQRINESGNAADTDVFCRLAWCRKSKELVGVSMKGRAVAWSIPDGSRRELHATRAAPLSAVAVAADGKLILGSSTGELVLQHLTDRAVNQTLSVGESTILDVERLPGIGWLIAQEDGTLSVVGEEVETILQRFHETAPIRDVDVDREHKLIAVASGSASAPMYRFDQSTRLIERSGQFGLPLNEPTREIHSVAFMRRKAGDWLCATDDGGRVIVWRRHDRRTIAIQQDQDRDALTKPVIADWPLPLRGRRGCLAVDVLRGELLTAGQDTVIKRWPLDDRANITQIDSLPHCRIAFDPILPKRMWVAGANGQVQLVDTRNRALVATIKDNSAHRIADIGVASSAGIVATCSGSSVRLWQWEGDSQIAPCGSLNHDAPLRSVAISPDASRVGAYDTRDNVVLWDATSGRLMASRALRANAHEVKAIGGIARFNRDGRYLAAAGPAQTVYILDGQSLAVVRSPYLAAGDGCTALAWSPAEDDGLAAGDTLGRLMVFPSPAQGILRIPKYSLAPRVSLSFSPDGRRLAAACANGELLVSDPRWTGVAYKFQSRHIEEGAETRVTQAAFDPTGTRLAVAHEDGRIDIYEAGTSLHLRAASVSKRSWHVRHLTPIEGIEGLSYRRQSVQLDAEGRVLIAAVQETPVEGVSDLVDAKVCLLRETAAGDFEVSELEKFGRLDDHTLYQLCRSIALHADANRENVVFRRPLPQISGLHGELLWCETRLPTNHEEERGTKGAGSNFTKEVITAPDNFGFDTTILSRRGSSDTVLHFSHNGHYLMATYRDGADWTTTTVGRQGDGLRCRAAVDQVGAIHVITPSTRFNGDPYLPVYLQLGTAPFQGDTRLPVDSVFGNSPSSIVTDNDGDPIILYSRRNHHRRGESVVARLANGKWLPLKVFPKGPSRYLSNLVADESGRIFLAQLDFSEQRLYIHRWASGTDWQVEQTALPLPQAPTSPEPLRIETLVLRRELHGQPVIILGSQSADSRYLFVLRP